MDKKNRFKIVLFLSIIFFLLLFIINYGTYKNEYIKDVYSVEENINSDKYYAENNSVIEESSIYDEKHSMYIDYIDTEGDISDDIIQYLDLKLQSIPEELVSKYFEQNGKILLTDKDISNTYYSEYNFGSVIGIHDANKNIIYISNSEYAIDNALIHEFGHVLDYFTNWSSMGDSFSNIFIEEKDLFEVYSVDNHYKKNQREFFAEVFQQSILESDSCKSSAPKAYNFVNEKIKSLI